MGLCCRVSSALRVEAISAAWSSLSARPSESSLASPRQPQRASPVAAYCGLLRRITAYCGLLRRWPALASLRKPRRASLAPLRPTGLLRLIAACCSLLRLIAAYCGLLWLIAACYGLLSLAQCRSDRHLPPRTARGRRSWSGGRKFRGDIGREQQQQQQQQQRRRGRRRRRRRRRQQQQQQQSRISRLALEDSCFGLQA